MLSKGEVLAQGSQFSLEDVEVVTAVVDLEAIRAYRATVSRCFQAAQSNAKYERFQSSFRLSPEFADHDLLVRPSTPIEPLVLRPEKEIAYATGSYLWDYLTRSGQAGFLIPLSGGIDSCATAVIVYAMCSLVITACKNGNKSVTEQVKRIARYSDDMPSTPHDLCNQIFHTVYMGMSRQSSKETRQRAKDLAEQIGSHHIDLDIDEVYNGQKSLVSSALGFDPKFKVEGGSWAENLALQNIQA